MTEEMGKLSAYYRESGGLCHGSLRQRCMSTMYTASAYSSILVAMQALPACHRLHLISSLRTICTMKSIGDEDIGTGSASQQTIDHAWRARIDLNYSSCLMLSHIRVHLPKKAADASIHNYSSFVTRLETCFWHWLDCRYRAVTSRPWISSIYPSNSFELTWRQSLHVMTKMNIVL